MAAGSGFAGAIPFLTFAPRAACSALYRRNWCLTLFLRCGRPCASSPVTMACCAMTIGSMRYSPTSVLRTKRMQICALSGGMKRRVLIAQALMHRPAVIVLDEPTAGVDVELRQTLWKFITQLNRAGHTIVLTTHYLEEAEQLCTRIAMLQRGEIVALDHTRALLQRFSGADLEEVFMQVMRLATHR